jgi:hypothetical protein
MKTATTFLAVAFVLSGCSQEPEVPSDANVSSGVVEAGGSPRAIRAEVGQFLLLRQDGLDVALKIVEHTRPSQDDAPTWGARYECFVFDGDDYSRFQRYAGEVYERESGGVYVLPSTKPEYVDCGTFHIEWSLADWIYFDDSISAMARTEKTDIADVNFLDQRLQWHRAGVPASSIATPTSRPPDINTYEEQIRTGVGENAIRAEVGKFLLLKRDGPDVALKIIEHTRPSQSNAAKPGAWYECFVFENHDYSRFTKYTGEVYEPDEGVVNHVWIKYGMFQVEWSQGDWIYFRDSISAMARTDKADIKDVNFADPKLQWHYPEKPASVN